MIAISLIVIWIISISGVVPAVVGSVVPIVVVTIGCIADGAVAARRGDRGDERDWENAPGHGEPRTTRKQRVCQQTGCAAAGAVTRRAA
jgi:hypothetical protein